VTSGLLAFAEQTTDFVGVSDPWGRILYLNPAAQKRLGVVEGADLTIADLFPSEAFTFYYEVVRPQLLRTGAWTGEVLVNAAGSDATPMYVSTIARLGPGGEVNGGVVYAHELPRIDLSIVSQSDVDETSGLLSRSAFDDRAGRALAVGRRDGEGCALVLAEIGDASDMVEALGALAAANVMRALAGRMSRLARSMDVVGRVDDYQLALLLRGVRNNSEASRIARTVRESLVDRPITTPGGELIVCIDCGYSFSEPGDDLAAMIARASATPIRETGNRAASPGPVTASSTRVATSVTMDDFRVAMSHGHVVPYAQPVVELGSGRIVGYQGLARWHHHTLGNLNAGAFIDMIAETPLANEVDLYVARENAAVLLLAARGDPLHLYTPVSTRLIADVRTEQYLSEIADAFFLPMHQIHLQIARPLLDHWTPALQDALQSLRDATLALAVTGIEDESDLQGLDDFGFSELHITTRVANAAADDPAAKRVVSDIVRHAHDHGLRAVATGITNRQHERTVIEAGCDLATGNLYGKPEPTNTIEGP